MDTSSFLIDCKLNIQLNGKNINSDIEKLNKEISTLDYVVPRYFGASLLEVSTFKEENSIFNLRVKLQTAKIKNCEDDEYEYESDESDEYESEDESDEDEDNFLSKFSSESINLKDGGFTNNWEITGNNIVHKYNESKGGDISVLRYIIEEILKPNGVVLNGVVFGVSTKQPVAYIYKIKDNVIKLNNKATLRYWNKFLNYKTSSKYLELYSIIIFRRLKINYLDIDEDECTELINNTNIEIINSYIKSNPDKILNYLRSDIISYLQGCVYDTITNPEGDINRDSAWCNIKDFGERIISLIERELGISISYN